VNCKVSLQKEHSELMNNANITSTLPTSSLSTSINRNCNNYKIKLALNIIGEHFGDLVRDVAKVLVDNENCTLMTILRIFTSTFSSSPATVIKPMFQQSYNNSSAVSLESLRKHEETVRHALLILQTHNCVAIIYPLLGANASSSSSSSEENSGDTGNANEASVRHIGLIYKLEVDNVINRLRLPHFMFFAQKKFGDMAVHILEEVVRHGKIKFSKIQEGVVAILEERYRENAPPAEGTAEEHAEAEERSSYHKDEVKNVFEDMVQHRFLLPAVPLQTKQQHAAPSESWAAQPFSAPQNAATTGKAGTKGGPTENKRTVMKRKAVEDAPTDPHSCLPMELQFLLQKNKPPSTATTTATTTATSSFGSSSGSSSSGSGSSSVEVSSAAKREGGPTTWHSRTRNPPPGAIQAQSQAQAALQATQPPAKKARVARKQTSAKLVIRDQDEDDYSHSGNFKQITRVKEESIPKQKDDGPKEEVVWSVCWDQLLREYRHRACIGVATARMGYVAGVVVSVILERSMNGEVGSNQLKSAPLSTAEIMGEIRRKVEQDNHSSSNDAVTPLTTEERMSLEAMTEVTNLRSLLDVLRLDSLGILLKVVGSDAVEGGPTYMVNKESIISALQRSAIHKTCVERYGNASGRIVQLLYRSKYLDQQVISDCIIVPARETRERLYRLHLDKWVNYIELSKRLDFNSSTNYYFWYLDPQRIKTALLDHLFKAMFNVRLRHAHEYEQNKDLLELTNITTEYDQAKLRALNGRFNALDKAMIDLDRSVILLERF
jgi:transcription initiation factor IIE alpha subunit